MITKPSDTEVKALKKAYEEAVERKDETFWYQGQEVLVSYANYLLQYWGVNNVLA